MGNLTLYVPDELERHIRRTGVPLAATCRPALEEAVRQRDAAAALPTQQELLEMIGELLPMLSHADLGQTGRRDLYDAYKLLRGHVAAAQAAQARALIEQAIAPANREKVANALGWSVYRLDQVRRGNLRPGDLAHLRKVLDA
jgi:hypothetical protein